MSFDRSALAAGLDRLGPAVRVLVAGIRGSTPREAGAAMLVGATACEGTIGGGALEWQAIATARQVLARGEGLAQALPLGPALGQCCGGAVTLAFEVLRPGALPAARSGLVARPLAAAAGDPPLAVARMLSRARAQGWRPEAPVLADGWLVEAELPPPRPVWIWGAGHVGRALVAVLAPLPGLAITWVDTAPDRFPQAVPPGVTPLVAADPGRVAMLAPADAAHLILTYSHALDLDLCHRLLGHGFASCGLIGSASKWARFRGRLRALGHADAQILRIACPIGEPELGKHPQAIAVGVAAALLRGPSANRATRDCAG
ncbi:xanthine dehydrogenase accessory protein XdhC [Frigidibacter oleivorans]|uniref:xanthine dehydrogenase accessory protein XdhC n=1 Tax=Frigidibacter oleivorans TaxID=2487129 RepID=UPI000F8E5656|nr:xanthine dehydrogenase accessory protein XdhC [Frigidibacter oleivorans]